MQIELSEIELGLTREVLALALLREEDASMALADPADAARAARRARMLDSILRRMGSA
jgi:hypothetical protein